MSAVPFVATADRDVSGFLNHWRSLQGAAVTPFQHAGWLESWYATVGSSDGREPLCVTVRRSDDAPDAPPLMLMPLSVRVEQGLRVVRFADGSITDYNAPLLREAVSASHGALWHAVRAALRGQDVFIADKMLAALNDVPNPLLEPLRATPCDMFGNYIVVPPDYDAWRHTLDKRVRKEFERTWRVFQREPQACFEHVTAIDQARRAFGELEAQQRERMAHAGDAYVLDQAAFRAHYLHRLEAGLADGSVVLTTLRSRESLVAALYGICDGGRYVALRISHAGDAWRHCVPGKLLLERTLHHMHARGIRHFDFAIGDYFHKRVFGVSHTPLVDACVPLSALGWSRAARWHARRLLKRQRWVVSAVRRLRASRA